jgi:hypothetical protein
MIRRIVIAVTGLALAACAGGPRPSTVDAVAGVYDWQNEPGAKLNAAYQRDMTRLLQGMAPADAAAALRAAQYVCEVGDATACKRSFATRACQMDWDLAFPTNGLTIPAVAASFRRDCVGVTGDWPTPRDSAIDDQLAPPPKPVF